jgi:hypothetical protein
MTKILRIQLFLCAVVAFGCGSSYEPAQQPTTSHASTTSVKTTTASTDDSPLHHAMRPNPPPDPHAKHGPISLTGEMPYGERFDPSGWSGTSTPPEGMGGGPASTGDDDNPYVTPGETPDETPDETPATPDAGVEQPSQP